jgi:hypothetical protein
MDEQTAAPGTYPVDELAEVRRLLAEPLPTPDVVEAARAKLERVTLNRGPVPVRGAGEGWRPPWSPGAARPARRWPGWLAPIAAAASVAAVVTASVTVSAIVQRGQAGTTAAAAATISRVPPFFVSIPRGRPGPAVIAATATGTVLGRVDPPVQDPVFTLVTAAADDRTFVFAAIPGGSSVGPDSFYKLVLDRSGHPGRLTPLPIPAEPGLITGLAVSPDGSKLAVSVLGPNRQTTGPKLKVFSVATGTEHDWVWPGAGWTGWAEALAPNEFLTRTLTWTADNRRLLFIEHTGRGASGIAQARILDTAARGSDLRTASRLVPIPAAEIFPLDRAKTPVPPFTIDGPLMITRDGTKIVAPTGRVLQHHTQVGKSQPMLEVWITEFSVSTGKPVRELARQQVSYDNNDLVLWVDATGTAMVVGHPRPKPISADNESVVGVQTPGTFAPLPPRVQHDFQAGELAW